MKVGKTPMSNLPKWPGASEVYSKAYRILEATARAGHVTQTKVRGKVTCHVSEDMDRLIKALGRGDEEEIKGLVLEHATRDFLAV